MSAWVLFRCTICTKAVEARADQSWHRCPYCDVGRLIEVPANQRAEYERVALEQWDSAELERHREGARAS